MKFSLVVVASVLSCLCPSICQQQWSESISAQGLLGSHFGVPGLNATFDYVIIGGGTAGLTIARRLAANQTLRIAVVEAGDFQEFSNGNYSSVPAHVTKFVGNNPKVKNPYLDWYIYTKPQLALKRRRALYNSGKAIGGSSVRNHLWLARYLNLLMIV